jgi:hypothetical protein
VDVFLVKGEIYMTILLTNFFLCLLYAILAWFFRVRTKTRNFDKFFMAITFLQLVVVHSFIDPLSVPDLPSYQEMFSNIGSAKFGSDFTLRTLFNSDIEIGYLFFYKFVAFLSSNFVVFLLCVSLIIIGSYFYVIKKYSPYVFISIIMLLLTSFNQSIFVLRQHIAIAICLLSIPFVINRNQIKFLLIVFVAFLFHRTAVIFLPIYYLYGIKNDKILVVVCILVAFFIFFSKEIVFNFVNENINRYSSYDVEKYNSIINILIPLTLFLVMLLFMKGNIFKEGINKLLTCSLLFTLVYTITTIEFAGMGRLMTYFNSMYVLVVPITMKYIKNNELRYSFAICSVIMFFVHTFFTESILYLKDLEVLF